MENPESDYFVIRAKLKGKKSGWSNITHGSGGSGVKDLGIAFGRNGGTMKFYTKADALKYAKRLPDFDTEVIGKVRQNKIKQKIKNDPLANMNNAVKDFLKKVQI